MVASSSALVGFTGPRSLHAAEVPFVQRVVSAVVRAGRGVAVGCARGADAAVRQAAPAAQVFTVAAFQQQGLSPQAALARRSQALVQAVAAAGPGSALIGFVGSACPARLAPSASASACFSGRGSGTWASLAYAAGLGTVPVIIFAVGQSAALPAWPGGSWQAGAGRGVWARAWHWQPFVQASLLVPADAPQLATF